MRAILYSVLNKTLILLQLHLFAVHLMLLEISELLEKHNATDIQIIPKIENQEGVDNIDEILRS